jgi:energy-coupling factor transport system ATP-binding protein
MEIKNLSFSYDGINNIFYDASLSLKKGCYAVTGSNGSGKTTLVRIISGVAVDLYKGKLSGEISIDDEPLKKPVVIPQELDSSLLAETAYDEVSFFSLNKNFMFKNPDEFFKIWGLDEIKNKKTDRLSSGEKQRYIISVNLSFSNRAALVIMDEPLAFLDDNNLNLLIERVGELKKNFTVLIVGHRFDEMNEVIDGYFEIRDKRIEPFVHKKYQSEVFIKGNDFKQEKNIVAVKNLSHRFLKKSIDFELKSGEIKVLYGPNGSGKTTVTRILAGMIDDYEGDIYFCDRKADRSLLYKNVFPVMSNPDVEIMARRISDMFNGYKSDVLKKYMEGLKIYEKLGSYASHLSYGEKQKFLMVNAILSDKKLIIVDEPFLSFDIASEKAIFLLMREYLKNGGSVIVITHRRDIINSISCDVIEI